MLIGSNKVCPAAPATSTSTSDHDAGSIGSFNGNLIPAKDGNTWIIHIRYTESKCLYALPAKKWHGYI